MTNPLTSPARRIVTALVHGAVPVINAFVILFIITAIYGVLGTHLFGQRSPEYFGRFGSSLFTMMQVVTGDSWASVVTRSLFPPGEPDGAITFFFVSYVIVAGTVLLNVVLTVLLDEFLKAKTPPITSAHLPSPPITSAFLLPSPGLTSSHLSPRLPFPPITCTHLLSPPLTSHHLRSGGRSGERDDAPTGRQHPSAPGLLIVARDVA